MTWQWVALAGWLVLTVISLRWRWQDANQRRALMIMEFKGETDEQTTS